MSSLLKRGLYRLACWLRVPRMGRLLNRDRLLVIAYHGLRDTPAPPGTSWSLLPLREFERQMEYLKQHYRVLPIDEALTLLRTSNIRQPTACITFDDGYRSNHSLALPVLQRLGLPASVFLTTGMIGTRRLLWTIEMDRGFQESPHDQVDLEFLGLGKPSLPTVAARARAAREVISRLKRLEPEKRDTALARVRAALGINGGIDAEAYRMMSWNEVREMESTGLVSFGAHTVNHEILSRLPDAQVEREICGSVAAVREQIARPSRTFAYPNGVHGDFDRRSVRAIQSERGIGALATIEGLNGPDTDPFAIRRFNIGSEMSLDEFRLLTSGMLRRRARV